MISKSIHFPSLSSAFPIRCFICSSGLLCTSLFSVWLLPSALILSLFISVCLCDGPSPSLPILLCLSFSLSSQSMCLSGFLVCLSGSPLRVFSRFSSRTCPPPPVDLPSPRAPPPHPSWEMNMSPYWMPRPEPGDGARPASRIFFMHIEEMVMSAFALLHGKTAFPAAVASGRGWPGAPESPQWAPSLVAAAGPQRDGRCWGPRGRSDLSERSARPPPPWASPQRPAALLSLEPRYGNPRLARDGSLAPPARGPLSPLP